MKEIKSFNSFKFLYVLIVLGFSFNFNAQQINGSNADCSDFEDGMGRKVRSLGFDGNEVIYEVKGLAHGLYTIAIYYSNGTNDNKRIIIK
ncbi:MAG: hypothetical protein R3277_00880 [Brumimicrobium sp.]|nr:hypothetical protein [Brumimicrobium sp.]